MWGRGAATQADQGRTSFLQQRWRAEHGATKWTITALAAGIALLLALILIAFILTFYNPRVLSTADIHTERLAVDVIDAQKAAFYVAGVKIGPLGNEAGGCSSGLVTPARGTTVAYGRVGDGPLEITLKPSASATGVRGCKPKPQKIPSRPQGPVAATSATRATNLQTFSDPCRFGFTVPLRPVQSVQKSLKRPGASWV